MVQVSPSYTHMHTHTHFILSMINYWDAQSKKGVTSDSVPSGRRSLICLTVHMREDTKGPWELLLFICQVALVYLRTGRK